VFRLSVRHSPRDNRHETPRHGTDVGERAPFLKVANPRGDAPHPACSVRLALEKLMAIPPEAVLNTSLLGKCMADLRVSHMP
jgi:hypothetical protein